MEKQHDQWLAELRNKAEQRLSRPPTGLEPLTAENAAKLIDHLQIHQTELELQNEELRETQNKLEQSRDWYWLLFHQAPAGYVILDDNAVMRELNLTLGIILQMDRSNLLNRPFTDILHPDDQDLFRGRFRAFSRAPEKKFMELRLVDSAGRTIVTHLEGKQIELSLPNQKPTSGSSQLWLTLTDIRHRRQAEADMAVAFREALQAGQVKTEFLSSMSHELKTPMNAMLGFAQLLSFQNAENLTAQQRHYLNQVQESGRQLLELIEGLLDFSQIESGTFSVQLQSIDAARIVDNAIAALFDKAAHKHITLDNRIAPATGTVMADPDRLQQVLHHLIGNAIRYHHDSGRVTVMQECVGPDYTRITVEDDGPGISARIIPDLFAPFRRKTDYLTSTGGAGIGLPLAKRLIEAMQGSISVESSENRGSRFAIVLRRHAGSAPYVPDQTDSYDTPSCKVGEGQIPLLYVEDNPTNQKLVGAVIKMRPALHLLVADDGRTGIHLARRHRPRLILLDLNLPDINGYEVLVQLRRFPETREIPVAAISANARAEEIQQGRDAGFVDYITKPFDVNQLLHFLDEQLPTGPADEPSPS